MTTWLEANRLANLAAAQAHGDLGIDTSKPPIDVYGAIGDAGVVLIWRPLPRQFGAYLAEAGSRPGILINNGLPFAAQRQTAGHELGHHFLRHGSRVDADLAPSPARPALWTQEEKAAEAFAAWFLMPRKAVVAALARLGLDRPLEPLDVYRLSLLLGTPYLTTVRHLPSLRLANQIVAASWARAVPGDLKARLDPAVDKPRSRQPDVWLITSAFAGLLITAHPGDRLVIKRDVDTEPVEYPGWLRNLPVGLPRPRPGQAAAEPSAGHVDRAAVLEVGASAAGKRADVIIGDSTGGQWTFHVKVERAPVGIARRWIR